MNIAIIGMRTQGKSTLALYIARIIQAKRCGHVIAIFDPKRTYNSIPHTSDIGELEHLLETERDAVSYQPLTGGRDARKSDDQVMEEFSEFFDALGIDYHLGKRESARRPRLAPFVLLVDEAWFLQGGMSAHPRLEDIVRLADAENFYLIQTAHRPKDFSTKVRAQINELFIFQQWLAEDIEIIREWCGEDIASVVRNLPKHHVVRYEIDTRKFEIWFNPKVWYSSLKQENEENGNPNASETETGSASGPDSH
ncbi:MAG TPA: hypothetical protein VKJ65_06025 [Phycisphaerae bacterium]|nr:hypothetical protein [Phycisphaerae bacterium]